jgi:hypothetical protein
MKQRLLTIFVTAVVTSLFWCGWSSVSRAFERPMLMYKVQVPGRKALDAIQADLNSGRNETAQAKVTALRNHWAILEAQGLRGQALERVMLTFAEIEFRPGTSTILEPNGAVNRSQPVRVETNSTSPAAGSRR